MAGKCPECGGRLVKASVELACTNCGLVVSDLELVPAIPPRDRQPSIWDFASFRNSSLTLKGREVSEKDTLLQIKNLCNILRLPGSVEGDAARILRWLRSKGRKYTVREGAAIAVYIAARVGGHPVTVSQIAASTMIGETKLFSLVASALPALDGKVKLKPATPDQYIPKILAKLPLPENYKGQLAGPAAKLARELWSLPNFKNRRPLTIAALAVAYIDKQLGNLIPLQTAASLAQTTSQTLLNHLNYLQKNRPVHPDLSEVTSFTLFTNKTFGR